MKPIALKDLQNDKFGSVFLDNLTLSSALRAIRGYQPYSLDSEKLIYKWPSPLIMPYSRLSRWDYSLNDAFRFAVDIYSLAQLVEAIVLFDKIYVDVSHADRWHVANTDPDSGNIELCHEAKKLEQLVTPIVLQTGERLALAGDAVSRAALYYRNEKFRDFMKRWSQTSTESVFIHMSHGHFKTGFSDVMLFPDTEIDTPFLWALDLILSNVSDEGDKTFMDDPRVSTLFDDPKLFYESTALFDFVRSLLAIEETSFVLAKTDYYDGDVRDKMAASVDVIRSAIVAYFHQRLASVAGLAYFPHLLRSNFIIFDRAFTLDVARSSHQMPPQAHSGELFLQTEAASKVTAFSDGYAVDLEFPFLLAMILQEVTGPEDIIEAALALRQRWTAQGFRSCTVRELDGRVANGKISRADLERELGKIKRALADWSHNNSPETPEMAELSVAIGLNLFTKSAGAKTPQLEPRPRLLFLQRLAQISSQSLGFQDLIRKVYGQELGDFWARYRQTMT